MMNKYLGKLRAFKSLTGQICLCVSLMLLSCSERNTSPTPDFSFELDLNETQVFAVNETNYAINDEPITTTYFIRETVVEIAERTNETTYTVERYRRVKESDQWLITKVYKLRKTPAELIEIGELPIVKLTFPVIENASFNLNKYNSSEVLNATYLNVNSNFNEFTNTYSVYQANDSTLINLNRVFDVYSPSEGLIYKENTVVDYCQSSPECIGTGEVSFGKRVIWRRVM